ncbi:MAG: 6,7-dimethyl-8-ribityllumazine synthase [Pirellulaceae bacterium]|nr:6,7-dimethyl-8-ribityllumazine synthase [Pirellulaceae bacterium]
MDQYTSALKALSGLQSQVAIAVSTYNASITDKLLAGAIDTLTQAGLARESIVVSYVPGAWELPLAARWLADLSSVAAIITLGAVIRGETTHDQHINRAVSLALMELMQSSGKPVAFGLLTVNTLEQAIHRAGGDVGNKGQEAAHAALTMLALKQSLKGY